MGAAATIARHDTTAMVRRKIFDMVRAKNMWNDGSGEGKAEGRGEARRVGGMARRNI